MPAADAQAWLATMPDLEGASNAELLDWLRTYPPRQGASMKRLLRSSMLATAPRSILDRILDGAGASPGLVNRIVGGTGDIDSAQLALRLWELGRLVAADPELDAPRSTRVWMASKSRIAGTALEPAVDAFLRDHGHRGNDEYELASPAWGMDATPVYATIDRLRNAPVDRDPAAGAAGLRADADRALEEARRVAPGPPAAWCDERPRPPGWGRSAASAPRTSSCSRTWGPAASSTSWPARGGERGSVRRAAGVLRDVRRADRLHRVAVRLRGRDRRAGGAGGLPERPRPAAVVRRSHPRSEHLEDRAEAKGAAPDSGTVLRGIAVNGGVGSGPAKVVTDPADPRGLDPGDVLVCAITDPSWTPLFLGAAAVVCDTGAIQSHAAIVARELGIPAVMSVPGITAVADGTMLHVDGDTGEVRIG